MPQRAADAAFIPPERQSSRLRTTQESQQRNVKAGKNKSRPEPITPPDLVDEDDHEFDEDDALSSDDDGTKFRSRRGLQQSHSVTRKRTLADLMNLLKDGVLDLEPEYQRDVVWSTVAMSSLVNSIIEDWYIPAIILKKESALRKGEDKSYKIVCVDGKQRLSSVKAFIDGTIPCTDRKGRKWHYCEVNNAAVKSKKRRILSDADKTNFLGKTFTSCEYLNLTPEQEEDLFARVQKGEQLKPAEKLRATTGPWQELARLFERDYRTIVELTSTQRAAGFRNILASFANIVERFHPTAPHSKPVTRLVIPELQQFCTFHRFCDAEMKSHLRRVFDVFQKLLNKSPETFAYSNYTMARGFAPAELPAVSFLISVHMETRDLNTLIEDIFALRSHLRDPFQGIPAIRLESRLWKVVRPFVENLAKKRPAPRNVVPAASSIDTNPVQENHPQEHYVQGNQRPTTTSARSTPQTSRSSRGPALPASSKTSATGSPDIPLIHARRRSPSVDSVLGDSLNVGPPLAADDTVESPEPNEHAPVPAVKEEPGELNPVAPVVKRRRSDIKLVKLGVNQADIQAKRQRLGNAS